MKTWDEPEEVYLQTCNICKEDKICMTGLDENLNEIPICDDCGEEILKEADKNDKSRDK